MILTIRTPTLIRLADPQPTKPRGDASTASDDTEYFDVTDDALYFQAGTDPPPREQWDVGSSTRLMRRFNQLERLQPPLVWMTQVRHGGGQMSGHAICLGHHQCTLR